MRAIHNLGRTEWWPLTSIARTKIVEPETNQGPWRVVVQFKLNQEWMAVHETALKKDAQDWVEQLYK